MPRSQRISTKVDPQFRRSLDLNLTALGWTESDFLTRAMEHYYPVMIRLVKAMQEKPVA